MNRCDDCLAPIHHVGYCHACTEVHAAVSRFICGGMTDAERDEQIGQESIAEYREED